ncbi:MAG: heme-dependent oxidative N-demethylase subunit alpha family protein [Planctomycetota bacterium]
MTSEVSILESWFERAFPNAFPGRSADPNAPAKPNGTAEASPTAKPFAYRVGVRALPSSEPLFLFDENTRRECSLRRRLLREQQSLVWAWPNDTRSLECLDALAAWMRSQLPRGVGTAGSIPFASPRVPAEFLLICEDIVLLRDDADAGFPILGGLVCFPSDWSIREKMALPIADVHGPVPTYAGRLREQTERLMSALVLGRSVERFNWSLTPAARLDLMPDRRSAMQKARQRLDRASAMRRVQLRIERQTLTRLPDQSGIVFIIHTKQWPIGRLSESSRNRLQMCLAAMPDAILDYKGLRDIRKLL